MKVYILTDLEGTTGVVREEQTIPNSPEYTAACRLLTGDVNAAVEGAIEGGAEETIILDGHGAREGFNLILEEIHPKAKLFTGGPRTYRLPFLDSSINAVFLIGYHAMAGTGGAVLDHTMSTMAIYEVTINSVPVGEIGIDASVLGCLGVPVVLVTGCRKAVEEAKNLLGNIESVAVKEGLTRYSALCLTPTETRAMIKQAAKKALERIDEFKPLQFDPPYQVEIKFTHPIYADGLRKSPYAKFTDERTVRFKGKDLLEVMHIIGWY